MYKQFAFEGQLHESLTRPPLTVRRKLDLAALKISPAGWQALPRAARLALCHLPVDSSDELEAYRKIMRDVCAAAGVPIRPLEGTLAAVRPWNNADVPQAVLDYVSSLGGWVDVNLWCGFDEETRYAMWKLTYPKRQPHELRALLVELGLASGAATSNYYDEFEM